MKYKFVFDKLIRDKLKERIEKQGGKLSIEVLKNDKKFLKALFRKFIEESAEAEKNLGKQNIDLKEEVADLYEIIETIRAVLKIRPAEIEKLRKKKNDKNGKFNKRVFVKTVEVSDDFELLDYYFKTFKQIK